MLKLGTVFSGIGAIEHALERMDLDFEIEFACDNNGIDLWRHMDKSEKNKEIRKIESIEDPFEKKKYVDKLHEEDRKTNFVKKSYFANYDIDEEKFYEDIKFFDGTPYENKIDLFVGGSPCQSFSLVGDRKGFEDTRGTLFYDYIRLIREIKPKVFIFENVKGVLSHDDGQTWEIMKNVFDELKEEFGYSWDYDILNAKDYGIPQNRERLFVIGILDDVDIEFPPKRELDTTMKDFLLDNVAKKYYLGKKGVKFVTKEKNIKKRYTQINGDIQLCQKKNQQFNWHGDFVFIEENKGEELVEEKYFLSKKVKKYVMSTGTKNFYSEPEIDLDVSRPLLKTMHKMHRAGVDNYVTTRGKIRKLTPRECLRLMGFSDSFKIAVSDTQMYQQAGNSIVVDVLIAIVDKIFDIVPELAEKASIKKNKKDELEYKQLEIKDLIEVS